MPARFRDVPVTISAVGDPGSNSVTINATSTDPAAAQAYANATAARVVKVTNRDDSAVLVLSQLGTAALPTTADEPTHDGGPGVHRVRVHRGRLCRLGGVCAAALRRPPKRCPSASVCPSSARCRCSPAPARIRPTCSNSTGDERALEAFQQLRSYLHIMFQDANPVIAFTSCEPREGKSAVAAYTAWVLATPGRFVVAVDTDLRQPRLHEIFGVDLSPGVSDIPTSTARLSCWRPPRTATWR